MAKPSIFKASDLPPETYQSPIFGNPTHEQRTLGWWVVTYDSATDSYKADWFRFRRQADLGKAGGVILSVYLTNDLHRKLKADADECGVGVGKYISKTLIEKVYGGDVSQSSTSD